MFTSIRNAFRSVSNFALGLLVRAIVNFKVRPLDSTRRARLKLVYLLPLSVLSLPLIAVESVIRATIRYYREFKAVWRHKPLTADQLVGALLRAMFVVR